MDIIQVTYPLIKSEATNKGLKYFYTELFASDGITEAGYNVFAMSPFYGLLVTITLPADLTDFDTNIKPTATAVASQQEAQALSQIAQILGLILPGSSSGRSYGYTANATAVAKTVRATTYTPQGTNAQRSVNSTSANDTGAGTGARQVKITYFDASGNGPFTETVTLNGTTPVNTVGTNIALIERMDVVTVGSGGGNAGTIQIFTLTAGGGTVWGSIAIGDNQTFWAHHYVPPNKTCYVVDMEGSATLAAGQFTINSLNPINTAIAQVSPDLTIRHGTTHLPRPLTVAIPIAGPAIVFMNEKPDTATASNTAFAGFSWIQQ